MANVIIVCGEPGSGKSTSLRNLDPKETYIVNVLNKPLPWQGSKSQFSKDNKNVGHTDKHNEVIAVLKGLVEKRPEVKNVILDDIGYVMLSEFFARAKESGYGKFAELGLHFQQIIEAAKNMPDGVNVVFMFHVDDVVSDRVIVGKKLKLIGQMLDDKYNPLGVVGVALFTEVEFDDKGEAKYQFITNRCQINGITIPAKSPYGLFDKLKIDNDLSYVFKKMDKYYHSESVKETVV